MGGIIEARAGEMLKFGRRRKSKKGKGRSRGVGKKKKAGAPSVQAGTGGASRGWNFEGDLEATWALRKGPCFGGCLSVRQPERAVPCLGTPEAGPKGRRGTGESRVILRGAASTSGGPIVPRVQTVVVSL